MRGLILLSILLAAPLTARDLPVPADKGWQHAETRLILPATLDGLARTRLVDATADEHDVTASFDSADRAIEATVYIFHPAIDDVAMWFERSQAQIEARKTYGGVAPMSADPVAFAPPGGTPGSALRRSYTPEHGPVRATALAVMPLGEWLIAVRLSSQKDASVALERRLDTVIAAMRWPTRKVPAPLARPIPACAHALHFDNARPVVSKTPDLMMTILASAVSQGAREHAMPVQRRERCHDAIDGSAYGVYRIVGYDKGYTLALGDAGRVANVTASLESQLGKGNDYAVTLTDVDGSVLSFPSFAGMPRPDQVMKMLRAGPTGRMTTSDHQTTISLAPPPAR